MAPAGELVRSEKDFRSGRTLAQDVQLGTHGTIDGRSRR